MSNMTPPPGDHPRGSAGPDARGFADADPRGSAAPDPRGSAGPDTRGFADTDPRGSAGPDTRGSAGPDARSSVGDGTRGQNAGPDARGETALGTGHGTTPHGTDAPTHRTTGTPGAHGTHLLPHDESDKLVSQLHHAVAEFVDAPRAAVEEADHVLEEIAARFTEAVTQRRRTLRHSWQSVEGGAGKPVSSGDTEQLRLALKDYRELAERLLHV
ncbi:hypothetical protein [Streptomyces coeruleorubidus]|uniref:hypothetical protein n=1 Tax=Streptomyces coeruleorubidus TaxID=116188 RepID=UPI0033B4502F